MNDRKPNPVVSLLLIAAAAWLWLADAPAIDPSRPAPKVRWWETKVGSVVRYVIYLVVKPEKETPPPVAASQGLRPHKGSDEAGALTP